MQNVDEFLLPVLFLLKEMQIGERAMDVFRDFRFFLHKKFTDTSDLSWIRISRLVDLLEPCDLRVEDPEVTSLKG